MLIDKNEGDNHMAEVMYDDQKTRVVLLNRSFGGDGRNMKELRVRLTAEGALFFQFLEGRAPLNYGLSAAEADAFVESWLAYRTEQKSKEQAEQERQEALIAEACSLTAKYPAIKLETDASRRAWRVSVPSIAWGHQAQVDRPQDLLDLVKGARDAYQDHLKLVAESKATA
jgi:hypothetical protein